jgi:hypothetical protein
MRVSTIKQLLGNLLFDRLLGLQASVRTGSKLLGKLVNSASRINELQLAGVERMAFATNVDTNLAASGRTSSNKGVSATAGDCGDLIIGVDAVFHGDSYLSCRG